MKKIFVSFVLLIIALLFLSNVCYATSITSIKQKDIKIDDSLLSSLSGIIGIIQIVGTAVAVIAAIYLGIRYVVSSIEEKADIKKKLIPFVIGTVIFFGSTGILRIIGDVAKWI